MMNTRFVSTFFLLLALFITACAPTIERSAADSPIPAPVTPAVSALPTAVTIFPDTPIEFVSTGEMRFHPVQTDLATATPIDIPLGGKPVWIAGIPYKDGIAWAAVLEDGSLQAFSIDIKSSGYARLAISPTSLNPSAPLTIYSRNEELFALTAPGADASPLSPPLLLDPDVPEIAYITGNGDLVIWQNGDETRLPANALPDSHILTDGQGRLLLLANPTESYPHEVLGDRVEARGITLVETDPEPRIVQTISIPEPDVIEGIYPTWGDLNADGELEIIVTLSNMQEGARIVAFHEDGGILAEGPPIGSGFRWRHQLMIAPFGVDGENLLAVVRTPHIGGVLEFYRLQGNKLEIVTDIPGISTHSIGSRNLFTAQAGDFDDDGQVELLAPDQSHTRFGVLGIDDGDITWLDLGVEQVTNLAAVTIHETGEIWIAAGTSNNVLRIWLP